MKRPRIKPKSVILASTTNDPKIQALCKFNRDQLFSKKGKIYTISCFGIKKQVSKEEYDTFNKTK